MSCHKAWHHGIWVRQGFIGVINFYVSSSLGLIRFMMMSCHINAFHITGCLWNIIFYSIPYIWKIHLPNGSQFVQVPIALTFFPSPNHFPLLVPQSVTNVQLPRDDAHFLVELGGGKTAKYFLILTLYMGKWFISIQKCICIAYYLLMLWW